MARQLEHLGYRPLDPLARVDRDRHHREALRQRQQAVRLKPVPLPESLDSAQQDARAHAVALIQIEQCIGEEPAALALALAEIRGELDPWLAAHSALPRALPSAIAASPSATPARMLIHASRISPASAGRCVSSIQVENVV